jgi:zinc protease
LTVSGVIKDGEAPQQALARLERFVADTIRSGFSPETRHSAREQFGFLLGFVEMPESLLARNPYGVAFSLARRLQLGLDVANLRRNLDGLTETEFRRAASVIFAPNKHAGACVVIAK